MNQKQRIKRIRNPFDEQKGERVNDKKQNVQETNTSKTIGRSLIKTPKTSVVPIRISVHFDLCYGVQIRTNNLKSMGPFSCGFKSSLFFPHLILFFNF